MKIGFIGAGKMAEAIIVSLIRSKIMVPHQIFASDINDERRKLLKKQYGINTYSNNSAIPGIGEILFLCVKPQQLMEILDEISPKITGKHLIVSIVAGKKISLIQSRLREARVIRVMPNIACLVGEGMSAFCAGRTATESDTRTVARLLSCFGKVLELPENCFDAVTAISGSGPAFFAYFLKAITEAGIKEGLNKKDALLLAEQTMLGTSKLLIQNNIEPEKLIESVSSAKGTTEAGLEVLDSSQLSTIVHDMIRAAAKRSKELSGK